LTAMTTGIMFFISVFFAPIFASIPSWATGGALTIVGSLMIRKYVPTLSLGFLKLTDVFLFLPPSVVEINWHYIGDAVPAFLTLIIIPLTYKFVIFPLALALAFGLELTPHCLASPMELSLELCPTYSSTASLLSSRSSAVDASYLQSMT